MISEYIKLSHYQKKSDCKVSANIIYIHERRNKNLLDADERLKDNLFVIRNVESGSCVAIPWTMVVIGFVIELHDDERYSFYSFVRGISLLSDLKSPNWFISQSFYTILVF